jgi:hypothetical protein
VVVDPTCVAQIGNLDGDALERDRVIWERRREGVGIASNGCDARIVRVVVCLLILQVVDVSGGRGGGDVRGTCGLSFGGRVGGCGRFGLRLIGW